jgi:hypothetical protein
MKNLGLPCSAAKPALVKLLLEHIEKSEVDMAQWVQYLKADEDAPPPGGLLLWS